MTNKDLDELFRDKLKHHEVRFNTNAWNKADKMLAAREAQRRRAFYLKAAAVIILLVSSTIAGYFLITPHATGDLQAENQTVKSQDKEIPAQDDSAKKGNKEISSTTAGIEKEEQGSKLENQAADVARSSSSGDFKANRAQNQNGVSKSASTTIQQQVQSHTKTNSDHARQMTGVSRSDNGAIALDANNALIKMEKITSVVHFGGGQTALEIDPDYTILSEMPDFKPVIKHRLGVLAGASIAQAGHANGNSAGISTDPHFGITYEYLLSPALSLEMNALYRLRSHSGFARNESYSLYSFGRVDYDISVENERASYLEIPVFINWNPVPGHQFKAGASASYLLHSSNVVNQEVTSPYNTDYNLSGGFVFEEDGLMKSWDFGLQAGYEFEFISNLSFGARAYYGLGNVLAVENTVSTHQTNNKYVSGYLKYRFANL